jgi:hypothetical protein
LALIQVNRVPFRSTVKKRSSVRGNVYLAQQPTFGCAGFMSTRPLLVPRLRQAARTVDVDQCHGKEPGRIFGHAATFHVPLPNTGYRVQGSSAEDVSEDRHVYEPVPSMPSDPSREPGHRRGLGREGRALDLT